MKTISSYTFSFFAWKRNQIKFFYKKLGYSFRQEKEDYIKYDNFGKFHVKYVGLYEYTIHYDVDTVDGRHMTLVSTGKLQDEIQVIKDYKVKIENILNIRYYLCKICYIKMLNLHIDKMCKSCRRDSLPVKTIKKLEKKKLKVKIKPEYYVPSGEDYINLKNQNGK